MQLQPRPDRPQEKLILEKMRLLSADQISRLLDFVESLGQHKQDKKLRRAGNLMAEDAFMKVWDNAEDDVYDRI